MARRHIRYQHGVSSRSLQMIPAPADCRISKDGPIYARCAKCKEWVVCTTSDFRVAYWHHSQLCYDNSY